MKNCKLILKIICLVGSMMLLVGCSQGSEPQEAAEVAEVNPTETALPPSPTEIPPTATQIPPTETSLPPTETQVPPTETPTTEPTKDLTEVEFTEADLLGTWVLEARPEISEIFEGNGVSKYSEGEGNVDIGTYQLNGDVVTFTDDDCVRIVGGIAQEFTCSADYKATFYKDENDHAYLTFELIGEDEHVFRKFTLTFYSLWVKVE